MNKLRFSTQMKQRKWAGLLALIATLSFASCSDVLLGEATATSAATSSDSSSGTLTLSIPAVASWLSVYAEADEGSSNAKTSSARALAHASSVSVEILDSDGAQVSAATLTISADTLGDSSNGTISAIPVGSNYTINVNVYNSAVSSTDPVVTAQATGVTITGGTTNTLSLKCLPYSPTALTLDTEASITHASVSSEQWCSIAVEDGTTYYVTETGAYSVMGLFDGTGSFISTDDSYLAYTADYDGTLYIVDYAYYGAGSAGLTVSTTAPAQNEGTSGSPLALGLNVDHTFRIGPSSGSENISYYSFTVETAGDHALILNGYYRVNFHGDSGSVSTSAIREGMLFSDLAAGTYYLRLTNESTSSLAATGQIMDSAGIATNSDAEGSVDNPVELTLGTSHDATIGYHVYDRYSYYTFTTESSGDYDYTISTSNASSSRSFLMYIYSDDSFTTQVESITASTGNSVSYVLSAGQTYYMKLYNYYSSTFTFDLEVQAVTPSYTSLAASSDAWTAASISAASEVDWYQVSVSEGNTYVLYWDDSGEGSGSYTGNITVSAYKSDRSTTYFKSVDSAYSSGQTITVPSGEDTLYIRVQGYSTSTTGTYALKLVQN